MSFRRRTYPEILENVLTGLTGGVSGESHAYPPAEAGDKPYSHALEHPPVASIISVYGIRNNASYPFIKESDYRLKENRLVWQEKGNSPDPGTTFLVNYRSHEATAPVNDLHVGSVVRTLAESFSLELAGLYAQAELVYQAGFIDSSTGRSLDNVVALLGIQRIWAGRNTTGLLFTRSAKSAGDIHIPAGTQVSNQDGSIHYETTEAVSLLSGQNSVQVDCRDLGNNLDQLEADSLVILSKPLAGIDSVTNPQPTKVLERDESDPELRTRAKNFLHGSEKSTLGAIKQAIARQNIVAEVTENDPDPGIITITVHGESLTPDTEVRLRAAIRDVRPAGIKVRFSEATAPYQVDLNIRISTVDDLLEADLRGIQEQAAERVSQYIEGIGIGEKGSVNRIIGLILKDDRINDVQLLSASVGADSVLNLEKGTLDTDLIPDQSPDTKVAVTPGVISIINPALATIVSVQVQFPISAAPPSETEIEKALEKALVVINDLNSSELPSSPGEAEERQRQLTYNKLLSVIPLPGKPVIADYIEIAEAENAMLTASADPGVYQTSFLISSESGISSILDSETSPTINLTPFERLTLEDVTIEGRAGEGP